VIDRVTLLSPAECSSQQELPLLYAQH